MLEHTNVSQTLKNMMLSLGYHTFTVPIELRSIANYKPSENLIESMDVVMVDEFDKFIIENFITNIHLSNVEMITSLTGWLNNNMFEYADIEMVSGSKLPIMYKYVNRLHGYINSKIEEVLNTPIVSVHKPVDMKLYTNMDLATSSGNNLYSISNECNMFEMGDDVGVIHLNIFYK